jgi:flagellar biosynthesis chaperone FliJ
MAEPQQRVGIIRAIFRYFRFWNWRKARYILEAADQQFTGSVDGIGAAFDMHRDTLVERFQGLRNAIAEVEAVLEEKRSRLEKLNEEEEELIRKREGALTLAEQAQADGNTADYDKHAGAFERFQVRIEEIERTQERLRVEVGETSGTMDRYMMQLQEMQAEIGRLPTQKAEAIADFVSAKQIIELNDRLQGLETSIDRGPISAVLDANRRLTAKARISEKISGADVRVQDKAYEAAGRVSTARSKMEEMLAARKAEREGGAAEEKPAEEEKEASDTRPEI